ncbi:trp repressor binding protein [Legionella jordanis]|uniref:Trp repressor binding protein n=2 Tax=Legionella jordanis TaxID=456 RepID=A0A0W0V9W9_9GAMM|nr:trp repressor binding protein [Legionella jordanis]
MHGGQETTLTSMMLPLLHHGMLILGLPYTEASLNSTQTGGTPYGVTHVAGMTNTNPLSQDEITLAKQLGKRLGKAAIALSRHRSLKM